MPKNYDALRVAKWFYTARDQYEKLGVSENVIMSHFPDFREYFYRNLDEIESQQKRVWAETGSSSRFEEHYFEEDLVPIRSKATELASIDNIVRTLTVDYRKCLWFLPTLVQRPEFQERISEFVPKIVELDAKTISYLPTTIPIYAFYIKAYCPEEVYEKFVSECERCNPTFTRDFISSSFAGEDIERHKERISECLEIIYIGPEPRISRAPQTSSVNVLLRNPATTVPFGLPDLDCLPGSIVSYSDLPGLPSCLEQLRSMGIPSLDSIPALNLRS